MQPTPDRPDAPQPDLHNPGAPFDSAWLETIVCTEAQVVARLRLLDEAPAVDRDTERRLLRRAIRCIDLTTLADDDTAARVEALAERAQAPVPGAPELHVAAVCVYPPFVPVARAALSDSPVRVCTVAGGFPAGGGTLDERLATVATARDAGADEIDVVAPAGMAPAGRWEALHAELAMLHEACGDAKTKVILRTGEIPSAGDIARAGAAALMAGFDVLKTSTGKDAINATLEAGVALACAVRAYAERTAWRAGLKPAGGISTAEQALQWLALVDAELGAGWDGPQRFRFGASSLLDSVVARLEALDGAPE